MHACYDRVQSFLSDELLPRSWVATLRFFEPSAKPVTGADMFIRTEWALGYILRPGVCTEREVDLHTSKVVDQVNFHTNGWIDEIHQRGPQRGLAIARQSSWH